MVSFKVHFLFLDFSIYIYDFRHCIMLQQFYVSRCFWIDYTTWVEIYSVIVSSGVIFYCWSSSHVTFAFVFAFSNPEFNDLPVSPIYTCEHFNSVNTNCCWQAFWSLVLNIDKLQDWTSLSRIGPVVMQNDFFRWLKIFPILQNIPLLFDIRYCWITLYS